MQQDQQAHQLKMQAEDIAVRKSTHLADTITKMTLANEEFSIRWNEMAVKSDESSRDYVLKTIAQYQEQQRIDTGKMASENLDQNQKAQLRFEAEKFKAGQPNQFEKTMKNLGYGLELFGGAMKAVDTVLGWF